MENWSDKLARFKNHGTEIKATEMDVNFKQFVETPVPEAIPVIQTVNTWSLDDFE
jgi:hypothetical protein